MTRALLDGDAIRRLRYRQIPPIPQREIAERAGISDRYLSKIELGHRQPVRNPVLAERIAKALGVPLADILRTGEAA